MVHDIVPYEECMVHGELVEVEVEEGHNDEAHDMALCDVHKVHDTWEQDVSLHNALHCI